MNWRGIKMIARFGMVVGALLAAAMLSPRDQPALAAGGNSVTTPDPAGASYTDVALDSAGNPAVAYAQNDDLRFVRCNDNLCSGNDESIVMLEDGNANMRVITPTLVLDSAGYPVIGYSIHHQLIVSSFTTAHIIHCNDPDCAGGDDTDTFSQNGGLRKSSLVLDADDNPIAAYTVGSYPTFYPVLMHCNDPDCAGKDESLTTPTGSISATGPTSLALDSSGNPVFTYVETNNLTAFDLRLLHCDDPNCSGFETSNLVDAAVPYTTLIGGQSSLELDSGGFPVMSYFYYDNTYFANGELRLARCGHPNCVGGATVKILDTDGELAFSSLSLDASNNPIISYNDVASGMLHVLSCTNPTCTSTNPTASFDGTGGSSMILDGPGNPVISYADSGLTLLHCVNPTCFEPDGDSDGCPDKDEGQTAPGSEMTGGFRDPLIFWDFFDTPNASNVRDKAVASADFFRVLQRFGANDTGPGTFNRFDDPLSAPNAFVSGAHRENYHPAFDRGPSSGPNAWNLTAANGSIASTDFFAALAQFGHTCG